MDDLRTRHATSEQVHDLWSALYNMQQQIELLTQRLQRVENSPVTHGEPGNGTAAG